MEMTGKIPTLTEVIDEYISILSECGVSSLSHLFFWVDMFHNMSIAEFEDIICTPVFNITYYRTEAGLLVCLSRIFERLNRSEIAQLCVPETISNSAKCKFPFDALLVSKSYPLAAIEECEVVAGYKREGNLIIFEWKGDDIKEFVEYRRNIAIDPNHAQWIQWMLLHLSQNKSWRAQIDTDLTHEYGINFKQLMTGISLLEFWLQMMDR